MQLISRATLLVVVVLAACSTPAASTPAASTPAAGTPASMGPSAAPSLKPPASSTAIPQPSEAAAEGPLIATFRVVDEEYRILLTAPAQIENARQLLAGEEAPRIPNGLVLPGDGGVNTGWSWHIDPESLDFADLTVEVCDGRPSDVEEGTISGQRFCPWDAELIALEEA